MHNTDNMRIGLRPDAPELAVSFRGGVWIAVIVAIAVLTHGCAKQGGGGGGGGFSMPPMPVEVATAQVQKVADTFEGVGSLEASEAVTIVSEIDAVIVRLPFAEGSTVKKGSLIAQLDDAQLAAEVSRNEALMEQSRTRFERVKSVVEQKAGAPQDLDDASATLKVAEANLAVARARLAKARILAPFDGMIGARRVSVGTFLRAGLPITEMANIDQIRVNFSAPERFLANLRSGAEVTVSTMAYPDQHVKGTIIAIDPIVDQGTRSARVVARVANPKRILRPGMSANISAVLTERGKAVTVPNEAVFANGTQSFVFVVKPDSTVARVAVLLGTRMADAVEIVSGIESGATVVRAGHQKIMEGAKVMPVSSVPPAEGQVSAR